MSEDYDGIYTGDYADDDYAYPSADAEHGSGKTSNKSDGDGSGSGCGWCDLPDQSAASLRNFGFGALFAVVAVLSGFVAFGMAVIDWDDDTDIDSHLLLSTQRTWNEYFVITAVMGVVSVSLSMVALLYADRGFAMIAAVWLMATGSTAFVGFPNDKVVIFATAGVQPVCLVAAWLLFRGQEKLQEEAVHDGVDEQDTAVCAGCMDLPDMTLSRFAILIYVGATLGLIGGACVAALTLALGPEATVGDQFYNGIVTVIACASTFAAAWFRNRTWLLVSTVFCWVSLASLTMASYMPIGHQWSQDRLCIVDGLNSAQKDRCDEELAKANAYKAFYFVTEFVMAIVVWATWRMSETIQDADDEMQEEHDLDTTLADPFSCCGTMVQNPVQLYKRTVVAAAVVMLTLVTGGAIVVAAIANDEGLEEGLRKRELVLAATAAATGMASLFGALSNDRGFLTLSLLAALLFVGNAMINLEYSAGILVFRENSKAITNANTAWGASIFGSFSNVDYFIGHPLSSREKDVFGVAVAVAVFGFVAAVFNAVFSLILSEALQDKNRGATGAPLHSDDSDNNNLVSDDDDDYTYATVDDSASADNNATASSSDSDSGSGSDSSSSSSSGSSSS